MQPPFMMLEAAEKKDGIEKNGPNGSWQTTTDRIE